MMPVKKIILIVDDNRQNRMILSRILRADGYKTLEAENGRAALDLLETRQDIALMLLDISMPILDGYGVLEQLTASGRITTLPVIVTTGNEDARAEIRCLESGASDFLRKPYNAELVRHRVQSMLRLWRNAALINQLEYDQLTGAYSKEFFYRYAEELLLTHPDTRYYLAFLDIDDFKMINAHYGTKMGDAFLRHLGKALRTTLPGVELCGRIGGDSFVLLQTQPPPATQAAAAGMVERLLQDAPVVGVQLKIGYYEIDDRSLSVPDMCDRAKMAVSVAKHRYGIHFALYDNTLQQRAMREHQLASCMESALDQHQFHVYLQPKHDVQTSAVSGAEALARWIHPTLGFISPGEFIPLFERNGFISRLDAYMWEAVCVILRRWIDDGLPTVPISVNASRMDFAAPNLVERIETLVDSYNIPHDLIHFEVTESAYTDQPQQIISAVSALRSCGFLIEMDDFGAGYSSLNMLSELPIDILKLDMRFMQGVSFQDNLPGNKRNVLSFIISLSKWLRLPTVAEGVEKREEFDLLRSMGCDYIQGYYFAKPMPVDEFETYLAASISRLALRTTPVMTDFPLADADSEARKPLVLVVDDVQSNREMLQALLRPQYRVATACNGREACEFLQSHRSALDCMLLDLLMPVMDGFQVMEIMRASGILHEIPVIITTEAGPDNELHALRLGAHGYLAKPYNTELLLYHVHKVTEAKSFYRQRREFLRQSSALYEKAYQDELTALLNRHGLNKALSELPDDTPYALVVLDIDNLKGCNDTCGHAIGDKLIEGVANCLRRAVRSGDLVARTGGDEFLVLLQGIFSDQEALKQGERICKAVQSAPTDFPVACSGGVSVAASRSSFTTALRHADIALYNAKLQAKGSCCLWTEGMQLSH